MMLRAYASKSQKSMVLRLTSERHHPTPGSRLSANLKKATHHRSPMGADSSPDAGNKQGNPVIRESFSRIEQPVEPDLDPSLPRIGRRESEPHSAEVSYLHDVLEANFEGSRVFWDLHHYFPLG